MSEMNSTLLSGDNLANEQVAEQTAGQRRRRLFAGLGVVVLLAAAGYGAYWQKYKAHYVSTENAYTAAEIAQVAASIDGTVAEVRVIDTQAVKAGDILVVIDPTDARLALAQAQAEQAKAEAQVASAQADLERARIDLQRRQALVGSGSVSGDELSRAQNSFTSGRAAQASAQATVALARARVEKAQVDLARTVLRAPVDGIVAKRQVQVGQRVQASAALLAVVPMQEMHVDANFKEVELEKVRPGQAVRLTSDRHGQEVVYSGVVDGFSGGTGAAFALIPAQNATGNWIKVVQRLPVRIRLNAAELKARPLQLGLSMIATIDTASTPQ